MKNKDCSRIRILIEELVDDWGKLNLAAKSLVIIGIILFICVMIIALYGSVDEGIAKSLEIVFRSSLASVFGFLLSSNMKRCNDKLKKEIMRSSYECEDERETYNYKDGNIVQIVIAISISIVSTIFILVIYLLNITHNVGALSQIRDLMCTSIGFLIGESKINS